jgi:hypothetical protein
MPNTEEENGLPQFTADSLSVIYLRRTEGKPVLWKVPTGGGKPSQLTTKPMFGHAISPNGEQILYHYRSPELDSKLQVEVIPTPGGEVIRTFPNIRDAQPGTLVSGRRGDRLRRNARGSGKSLAPTGRGRSGAATQRVATESYLQICLVRRWETVCLRTWAAG